MPKTDVTDDRSLGRLQGIDFREHANQNTAHDACNVRLDHTSRLVPYPRPTKIKAGSFTFACEAKNPALEEFELDLDPYFGAPSISTISKSDDTLSIIVSGLHLANSIVILSNTSGDCISSETDFSVSLSDRGLVLDVYASEFENFDAITIINTYGSTSADAEITGLNNTLFFGTKTNCLFKMGIDPETLAFTIWRKQSDDKWGIVWSKTDSNAKRWDEDATGPVYTDYLNISGSESQKWLFLPEGSNVYDLNLKFLTGSDVSDFANAHFFEGFGPAGGALEPITEYHETLTEYAFGKFATYRLYAPYGENRLLLQMKSDSSTNNYDLTLHEWIYEE